MKVLSLLQPWASLLANGIKLKETRSWKTNHRGQLAIHASQKLFYPKQIAKYWTLPEEQEMVMEALKNIGYTDANKPLPAGKILGVGVVGNCREMVLLEPQYLMDDSPMFSIPTLTPLERALGHYAPGRFAWDVKEAQPLDEPVIFKGGMNLSREYNDPLVIKGKNVNLQL